MYIHTGLLVEADRPLQVIGVIDKGAYFDIPRVGAVGEVRRTDETLASIDHDAFCMHAGDRIRFRGFEGGHGC